MNKNAIEGRATKAADSSAVNSRPSDEEITTRAYEIFIARGASRGNDLDDWLQAERELVEKSGKSAPLHSVAAA